MKQFQSSSGAFNQTPPLADYNLYCTDLVLREAVRREGAAGAERDLMAAGAELGSAACFDHARLANCHPPVLHRFNANGERIDRIEFHPSWHVLMAGIVGRGYHTGPWAGPGGAASTHVARAAGYLLQAQTECGTLCPATMTYGAVAVIRRDVRLAADWMPCLLARRYDPRDIPAANKTSALIGMGMTEKQGGSDLRSNSTRAVRSADGTYRVTGHKWFFSAPQCDAHLVLAQGERGLCCLFVPRWMPDGTLNGIYIQRLKDKLGNRSNASAEVEFDDAWAHLLGEDGRGIATILEMGTYTRLDCVIGSAGLMRQAVVQALHHAAHRRAFGHRLIDQPLMRNVLVDLALESEAATALSLRLARAFDGESETEVTLRRVLTPAAKFWVCKRGCELAAEAMEVLGGTGYTEDLPLARIAREMPVNSIWEGSGNIMCLDVLRAFAKLPAAREVVLEELHAVRGRDSRYDRALARFGDSLRSMGDAPAHARRFSQTLVTLMQARLLLEAESGSDAGAAAEGFCATRLDAQSGWGAVFGASDAAVDSGKVLARAWTGS